MKYIFTIAMCLASLLSCNSTKNTEDTNKPSVSNKTLQPLPNTIEVETVARGLYKNVVITNGIAIFKADRTKRSVSFFYVNILPTISKFS